MGIIMIIPLAVHKNELVVIDSMEAFSHYFCLVKKQKMTPLAPPKHIAEPVADEEDEEKVFFDEGTEQAVDDEDAL